MESDADLRPPLDAAGADEHVVVRLEAEAATPALVARESKGVVGSMSLSRRPRVLPT